MGSMPWRRSSWWERSPSAAPIRVARPTSWVPVMERPSAIGHLSVVASTSAGTESRRRRAWSYAPVGSSLGPCDARISARHECGVKTKVWQKVEVGRTSDLVKLCPRSRRSVKAVGSGVPRTQHWWERRGPHREPAGRGSRAGLEPPQGAEGRGPRTKRSFCGVQRDIGGVSPPAGHVRVAAEPCGVRGTPGPTRHGDAK